jgi:hypothetical protein
MKELHSNEEFISGLFMIALLGRAGRFITHPYFTVLGARGHWKIIPGIAKDILKADSSNAHVFTRERCF